MKASRTNRPGRFALLLLAVVLFLVTVAVADAWTEQTLPLRTASSLLLVVALYAASGRRWILWSGSALVAVAIAGSWGSVIVARGALYEASLIATALFLALAAAAVLAVVVAESQVTLETITGAIGVYLLLGICFAYVHLIILAGDPGAYHLPDAAGQTSGALEGLERFIYFSFTTLTTLGYGEIHPIHPLAQLASNAEAVGGQLYIAVLVARLVTMYGGRGGGSSQREARP